MIRTVAALDTRLLAPLGPDTCSERIDSDFKTDLVKLVAKRYLQNALLPAPIANAVTLFKESAMRGVQSRHCWRDI